MLLFTEQAQATPIRPDVQKLISQPQEATTQFAPARAGWQGPEMNPEAQRPAAGRGLLDDSPASRAMRDTLIAVALPDARLVILVVMAIFLLRRLRRQRPAPAQPLRLPPPQAESPPAKAA